MNEDFSMQKVSAAADEKSTATHIIEPNCNILTLPQVLLHPIIGKGYVWEASTSHNN
jgi:hypothetical protein